MPELDWRVWLARAGVPLPDTPDVGAILLACAIIAASYWLGRTTARRFGPALTAFTYRLAGRPEGVNAKRIAVLLHYGLVALLLVIARDAAAASPLALLILAAALGLACLFLAYAIARMTRIGSTIAWLFGAIAGIAATAGALGGLAPLLRGLDAVGFTVGKRHFSLLGVLTFVVVVAVLFVASRIVTRIVNHSVGRIGRLDVSQQALVQKLAGIGVIVVATLLGLDVLGIDLTALTVFSGAAGLAVGFGLQKTLGNLIAGLILLMDRSIKPGDVIVVGDTFGQIGKIGIRAVSVVTRDGKEHLIPNEQLMTDPVENWSYSSRNVRIHIPVGIGYGSDLALAQRLMAEAAAASPRALKLPKPSVWLKGFGDSSVDHDILVWIKDPEAGVGNVRSDILNRLWLLFKEHGIELPFPQRDVHVRTLPERAGAAGPDDQ